MEKREISRWHLGLSQGFLRYCTEAQGLHLSPRGLTGCGWAKQSPNWLPAAFVLEVLCLS